MLTRPRNWLKPYLESGQSGTRLAAGAVCFHNHARRPSSFQIGDRFAHLPTRSARAEQAYRIELCGGFSPNYLQRRSSRWLPGSFSRLSFDALPSFDEIRETLKYAAARRCTDDNEFRERELRAGLEPGFPAQLPHGTNYPVRFEPARFARRTSVLSLQCVLDQHTPRAPGSTNPGSGAPLSLTDICEPHLCRGLIAPAEKSVAGTAMCLACFLGRPVNRCEAFGDETYVRRGHESWRRYYRENREELLAKKRRRRRLEKKDRADRTGFGL